MDPTLSRNVVDILQRSRQRHRDAEVWREIALSAIALLREREQRIRAQDRRIEQLLEERRRPREIAA